MTVRHYPSAYIKHGLYISGATRELLDYPYDFAKFIGPTHEPIDVTSIHYGNTGVRVADHSKYR